MASPCYFLSLVLLRLYGLIMPIQLEYVYVWITWYWLCCSTKAWVQSAQSIQYCDDCSTKKVMYINNTSTFAIHCWYLRQLCTVQYNRQVQDFQLPSYQEITQPRHRLDCFQPIARDEEVIERKTSNEDQLLFFPMVSLPSPKLTSPTLFMSTSRRSTTLGIPLFFLTIFLPWVGIC